MMRIENHTKIHDKELERMFKRVLSTTDLTAQAKGDFRRDAYIAVYNGKYSAVRGRIYAEASIIYREGKPIYVEAYIKLYVFPHTTMEELARTFAHELSHYRDTKAHSPMRLPRGKEARARAYADKIVNKLRNKGE